MPPIKYMQYLVDICPCTPGSEEERKNILQNLLKEFAGEDRDLALDCLARPKRLSWLEKKLEKRERIRRFGELPSNQPRVEQPSTKSGKRDDNNQRNQHDQVNENSENIQYMCWYCDKRTDHRKADCPLRLKNDLPTKSNRKKNQKV
jgi:hypothetical protein